MSRLKGCTIEPLSPEACEQILGWVAGGAQMPESHDGLRWLLAHCYDGVTWGKRENSHWRLSSTSFPDLCPIVSKDNLLEMRLFGEEGEIMIWRSEKGFLGRRLADQQEQIDEAIRPEDEIRILLGDRLVPDLPNPRDGFSRVATAGGTQQAVPVECTKDDFCGGRWPLCLTVRHYFEENPETGAVRVAATRLVNVFKVDVSRRCTDAS
ncbi:MAG TPA: CRISPR-associated protein Csx19 [Acidobacteriota bacterium]|nr:CRISPR-associated protein Csx19 [Acidobacteriota bacterium]